MTEMTGMKQNRFMTIGVTGGVGCGKSLILNYLKEHYNCRIILADDVANMLKEPGQVCYKELTDLLGKKILDDKGFIDKKRMAEAIFKDEALLKKVNDIIHPAVKEYLLDAIEKEKIAGTYDCLFIEAALLIECGYKEHVDRMWYIYADEDVRRERLRSSRGYSDEKISGIMNSQLSHEAFIQGSDDIIDNSGRVEETYSQIDEKMKELYYGRK